MNIIMIKCILLGENYYDQDGLIEILGSLCTHFWLWLIAVEIFFELAKQNVQKIAVLFDQNLLFLLDFRCLLYFVFWLSYNDFFLFYNWLRLAAGQDQLQDKFLSIDTPFNCCPILRFLGIIVFSYWNSLYCFYLHQIVFDFLLHFFLRLFLILFYLGLFIHFDIFLLLRVFLYFRLLTASVPSALRYLRLRLIFRYAISFIQDLFLLFLLQLIFLLCDVDFRYADGLLLFLNDPHYIQRQILHFDFFFNHLLCYFNRFVLLLEVVSSNRVILLTLPQLLAPSFTISMKTSMLAYSFTAVTLLKAHSLQIFFISHLPADLFDLEDALPLPHQDTNEKGVLCFLVIQANILELDQRCLCLIIFLVIVGLNVIDDLLLTLAVIAILFRYIGNIVFFLIDFADLLAIDKSLLHLFPEVEILVLDLVLYFLDDGEGDFSEGRGTVFTAVSEHLCQIIHIKYIKIDAEICNSRQDRYGNGSI